MITLAIAAAGGGVAMALGLPAPALLGASVIISIVALAGQDADVPDRLRDLAFATIGCSLGSGFTPTFLENLVRWPASVVAVCVVMLGIMAATAWILVRFFGQTPGDAVLATSPGALSVAIGLALVRGKNPQIVMVFQTIRLILITVSVPLALVLLGDPGGGGESAPEGGVSWLEAAPILVAALALGALGARFRLPASYMLGGMLASGALHLSGVVSGRFPEPMLFAGFVTTGALIGARFSRIKMDALASLGAASVSITAVALAMSALAAWPVASMLDIPFGQAWVAYAPGGVEAMAAMGISLHYDAAFIATHHLARILMLAFLLPVIFGRLQN